MNIQNYIELMEYHKPNPNGTNDKQKEGYISFSRKAFDLGIDDPKYRALSNLVHNSNLGEDTAYNFTYEALQAINEMLEDGIKLEDLQDQDLSTHAESPIYNYELLEFFNENPLEVQDAINEYGWNSDIYGSISLAYTRAWENHFYDVLGTIK